MSNKKQPSKKENAIWTIVGVVMVFAVCALALKDCSKQDGKAPVNAEEQLTN